MKIFLILTLSLCAVQCSDILIKVIQEAHIGNCRLGCNQCPQDGNNTLALAQAKLAKLKVEQKELQEDVQEAETTQSSVNNAGNATEDLSNAAQGNRRRRRKRASDSVSLTSCEDPSAKIEGDVGAVILEVMAGIKKSLEAISENSLDVTTLNCYVILAADLTTRLKTGTLNKPSNVSAIVTFSVTVQNSVVTTRTTVVVIVEKRKQALVVKNQEITVAKKEVVDAGGTVEGEPTTTPLPTTTVKTTFITHDPPFIPPTTTHGTTRPSTQNDTATGTTTRPLTTTTVKTTFITHDPPFVTFPPTTTYGTTRPSTQNDTATGAGSTTRTSTSSNATSVPGTNATGAVGTNITTNASTTAPNATTTARANSTTSTSSANVTSVANSTSGPAIKRLFCDEECGRSTVTVPRIVGGQDATLHEYPWQVKLDILADGFTSSASCGASIIKKSWLLTAAHCLVDSRTFNLFQNLDVVATFAAHNVSNLTESGSFEIAPKYVFVHPQYKKGPNASISEENDIALLYLDGTLRFGTTVKPICMPRPEDYVAEEQVVATGWGVTSYNGQTSNTLKEVALNLKSPENCTILNENAPETYTITDNMICALGKNKDACQGDSGGPLITQSADGRWVQLGIVSFGYKCAETNVPGFYTKLANYVNWIENMTQSSNC